MCFTCITKVNLTVEIDGKLTQLKDIEDPVIRMTNGIGHDSYSLNNRERHPGIGMYEPQDCLYAACTTGVWINYGQNLVCQGCGLDFT